MVTAVLEFPTVGEKSVMTGPVPVEKLLLVVMDPAKLLTKIGPEVAPEGTVAVISVVDVTAALAEVLLNFTLTGEKKFAPEMMMVAPAAPAVGENPVMTGSVPDVKIFVLTLVPALVMTVTGPVAAPGGTVASTSVEAM